MSWTLSGREAEALHAEEDDADDPAESDDEDPLLKIIQSRYYSIFLNHFFYFRKFFFRENNTLSLLSVIWASKIGIIQYFQTNFSEKGITSITSIIYLLFIFLKSIIR